ncbi:MAG: maleylpyruvate isomerase N-terminal domain-containing protein [Actinomycetota bacterium]
MDLSRQELIGIAHAERQRLGRMIQYAPPESWEQPSACPGWWNRDVVAHMGGQDTAAAHLLRGDPAEELDAYLATLASEGEFTVEGLNGFLVNNRSGLPYREVLTTWGRAAEATLDYAAALSDDAWRDARFPWLLGSIAARYLVQSRVVEWWVHGEDIRATAGLGPQIQHWPIFLTVDMGVRMLPWTLGEAGIDLQGASVQIDLEGAGEGSWHWGLGTGDAPPPDKAPDAFIQGRAPQFALVAAHRLRVDDVLDSGNVVLGGETAIAETVIRHIRAYP